MAVNLADPKIITMPGVDEGQPNDSSAQDYLPDDDQLALELAAEIRDTVAVFHSSWRVWENGYWGERDIHEVRGYIRKELRKWRKRGIKVTMNRVKSLTTMLEDDLHIPDRKIMEKQANQVRYINLKNGMFDLETMTFEPRHDPTLYFTNQLDFNYDPDAECPAFRKFLKSSLVLPDSTKPDAALYHLVVEAMAYSMTARTDMKSSFWLVGQKDSGKSTMIALLKGLMGSLHTTIDLTQLGTNRFLLSGIVGKRVITFTEASSNTVLPDALYKTLVGGSDEVYADVKNHDPIVFRPTAKVWWAMNEMPRVSDRSGATTRRIVMIPFNRSIPQEERISNLEPLLMRERSGIFNEMVAHYHRLMNGDGFERCEQSEALKEQYIMENDTEATFINECAEMHETYKERSTPLYDAYKQWCVDRGFKPKNMNQVAGEWRRLGFKDSKIGATYWHGLRLRQT